MRMDKLTTRFQQAIADAQSLAVGRDHAVIEPVHLLAAMLEQEGGATGGLLAKAGVDVNRLRSELGGAIDRLPTVEGAPGEVHMSSELGKTMNQTDKLAQKRGDAYISSELFLLAAFEVRGELARILEKCGAVKGALEQAITEISGGEKVDDPNAEDTRQALGRYTIDLTERAEQGKLDPVIGRDDEIRRTIQVLQRRTKNNPVLIGEPGVGKTAIVEGLAQKIVKNEVPKILRGTKIFAMDIGSLLAGTIFRGQFEQRLKGILKANKANLIATLGSGNNGLVLAGLLDLERPFSPGARIEPVADVRQQTDGIGTVPDFHVSDRFLAVLDAIDPISLVIAADFFQAPGIAT